jgi:hypothetical protein
MSDRCHSTRVDDGSGVTREQLDPEAIPGMRTPSPASYDKWLKG